MLACWRILQICDVSRLNSDHTVPIDDQRYKASLNLVLTMASLFHSSEEDLSVPDATFYIFLRNYHLLDHAGSTYD